MPIPNRTTPYSVIDNDAQELLDKEEAKARTEAIRDNTKSFSQAFAEARRARLAGTGGDTYTYNGRKILAYSQDDLNAMDADKFEQLRNSYKWIKQSQKELAGNASNAKQENISSANTTVDEPMVDNYDERYAINPFKKEMPKPINTYGRKPSPEQFSNYADGMPKAKAGDPEFTEDMLDLVQSGAIDALLAVTTAGLGNYIMGGVKGMNKARTIAPGIESAIPKFDDAIDLAKRGMPYIENERKQLDALRKIVAQAEEAKRAVQKPVGFSFKPFTESTDAIKRQRYIERMLNEF